MKRLIYIIFFVSAHGLADGYGGAQGYNSLKEIIQIGVDTEGFTLYVQKNENDHEWTERYSLSKECPNFTPIENTTFTCISHAKFPLSGATFKVIEDRSWTPCDQDPFFDKSPGIVYKCIKGCGNPRTPKIIYVGPWEC